MTVSIITVVYNGANTIAEAIESVLGQSYSPIEYIIIDGASTDGTADIIRSYGNSIARFISEPDGGIYDAMNKGIAAATGDIIGILNADDLYRHPDVIGRVVDVFQQQPTVDGVYGDLVYAQRNEPDRVTRYWRAGDYQHGDFLYGWMPPHPTFFVRTNVYKKYGMFTTSLRSAADYELMLRLIHKHQIRIAYLNEVLVVMRLGGVSNSSLRNRLKANREDRMAWQLNELKPNWLTLWLKPIRKLSQFWSKRT
ncbi:glycosyltransferase [Fibrella sp. HMF5335]|uniref:Glycosyltransferase n=1 Tax=Fibrella rubiginis TaxID=2817060 RepID=A0A939GL27_9BACT|nr:glycosyltransferase family 2 protein [Fibrella rubiginis]MBO0938373.1 glycosyltransferase [Fibrella rubiginis]